MKTLLCVLSLVFISLQSIGQNNIPERKSETDSIKIYLENALDLMKKKSVNSHKMNWTQLYAEAYAGINNVKTIRETYPVIKKILGKLEDHHSKFYPPESVKAYLIGYRAMGLVFPEVKAELLKNKYAYLSLPAFYSFNFDEWNEFVDTFRQKMSMLEMQHPIGWIIDIRDNEGGMFAPMYAAIAPLLSQQKVIGYQDGTGINNFMRYRNSLLYENENLIHTFSLVNPKVKLAAAPIVILINHKTASSAEFAAISFKGQQNVFFVGTQTNGLTSGNQEHKLSDGAFLVLTEGNTIDRNKKVYDQIGEGLSPDFKIDVDQKDKESIDILYLQTAYEVLNKHGRKKSIK